MKLKIIDYGYLKKPTRSHYNDSGMDVYSPEDYEIKPFQLARIPLNLGIDIPDGYEIQVRPRSSMNAKGILTQFGTVDAGYKGNIQVTLINLSLDKIEIKKGDKIAQLALCPIAYVDLFENLGEKREDKGFLKELNKPGNVVVEKNEQKENSKRDFSKPIWKKYHFKNGKDYELAIANSDGVLVFRDSIFSAPFDEQEDWDKATNEWEKCSLKPLLEKWWEENAPDVLKNNYKITIPEAYNIFPDELLPQDLKGKNQQWEIYKDWRNRLFGHHERPETIWVWTKSKHPSCANDVRVVDTSGVLSDNLATRSNGVVPACVPILSEAKSNNLECDQHEQPSGR